jgi:glycosidase
MKELARYFCRGGFPKQALARAITTLLPLALGLGGCAASRQVSPPPVTPPAQTTPAPVRVTPQADWSEAILYFVITDRWADGDLTNDVNVDRTAKGTFHGGDFRGLREHLDEIAGLGVTAIWITPVVKNIDGFVTGVGFPDWAYHGYWADDFTRLDPRFGSESELVALVEECHRRGMKVLLDVVYNHAGYGSRYLTDPKTKGWLRSEELGTCGQDDLTTCVAGLPDFRTERPEVAEFLLQSQLGWAKRTGVDGFRLDTVKHVEHAFWQEHRRRTREQFGAGFFLLGEVWGGDAQVLDPYFSTDELDAGFDFGFQGNVLAFVQGRGRTVAFDRYLKSREKVRPGYLLADFLSSHDVPGALFQLEGNATLFRLALVLQFTSIGIPVVFYGEEVGRPGGDWPDNRSDMPWGERKVLPGEGKPRDEALRADYIRLIAIRRAHPALFRGVHEKLVAEGDRLVFLQKDPKSDDAVVVAVNRGDKSVVARFPVPEVWGIGPVRDEWNAVGVPLTSGTVETTLESKAARILAREAPH